MEYLILVVIILCGFLAGSSARINVRSVPQRGPHHFWFLIAGMISIIGICGGIEGSVFWFIMKGAGLFFLAIPLGMLLAWFFRKVSPMVED